MGSFIQKVMEYKVELRDWGEMEKMSREMQKSRDAEVSVEASSPILHQN